MSIYIEVMALRIQDKHMGAQFLSVRGLSIPSILLAMASPAPWIRCTTSFCTCLYDC